MDLAEAEAACAPEEEELVHELLEGARVFRVHHRPEEMPCVATRVSEQLLHTNVQRLRSGIVFKAHRLCVSLKSRLDINREEEHPCVEHFSCGDGCVG